MGAIVKSLVTGLLVFSFSVFFLSPIQASEVQLVKITNDESKNYYYLALSLDERGDISSLIRDHYTARGEFIERTVFEVRDVERGESLVLEQERGRVIVALRSMNFSPYQGGDIELDLLRNGINGTRFSQQIDLARSGDDWALYFDGQQIQAIHFYSNRRVMVGTIGISSVRFDFKKWWIQGLRFY